MRCLKDRTDYAINGEKTDEGKYISSYLGFAKADNPAIIGIVLIDEPHGTYYGGTIAAPVMRSVFQTALPYMGIYKEYTPDKKEP